MMENGKHTAVRLIRFSGTLLAIAIVVLAVYLPIVGALDWAVLPFLLAFIPFALAHTAAWLIEDGAKALALLRHSRRHPLR